jgi:hypothetical protein
LWITRTIFSVLRHGRPVTEERLDATEAVRRLGGTADWQELVRYSTQHSVRRAITSGALRRISRGTYALPEAPLAQQAAAAARGLVSHGSAAEHWKLETLTPPGSAHVTVPPQSRPRLQKGVTLHFSNVPARDDHDGVTSPVRTVLDCARSLPTGEALAIADSALRRGLVTSNELIEAGLERRGPGRQRILRVAEAADAQAANPFESGLRGIILDAGLTGFVLQFPIRLPSGQAFLDLGHPVLRIALEADSFRYHMSPEAQLKDYRRHDELVCAQWLPLHFGWQHVMFESSWVAATVKKACALRDGSPPGSD